MSMIKFAWKLQNSLIVSSIIHAWRQGQVIQTYYLHVVISIYFLSNKLSGSWKIRYLAKKSTFLKETVHCSLWIQLMTVRQKVSKCDFSKFHIKNLPNLSDFFENKNNSLGAHFMKRFFLAASLYFLKLCPILDELSAVEFITYSGFFYVVDFWVKNLLFRTQTAC